jgi:hypothetical protein
LIGNTQDNPGWENFPPGLAIFGVFFTVSVSARNLELFWCAVSRVGFFAGSYSTKEWRGGAHSW